MVTQFIVDVANKNTGEELQLRIEAADAANAEYIANSRGLFVSAVRPVSESDIPTVPPVTLAQKYSPAQLLLLSKFRTGDSLSHFRDAAYWETALQERPEKAIVRFIKDGMIESADLPTILSVKFKVSDLKAMLKEKSLTVSGAKAKLVARLIDADLNEMVKQANGMDVYRCTTWGMQLAEIYIEDEKAKRQAVETEVFGLLNAGDYTRAAETVAKFEASQVFVRGLNVDWGSHDSQSDIGLLKAIFGTTPGILAEIDPDRMNQIRPAAGMMQLWGTGRSKQWLPDSFETGIHLDGNAACRMLSFYAIHLRNLRQFKECGIEHVQINGVGDEGCCDECQKLKGRKFRVDKAPELPNPKCTSVDGCRCMLLADVASFLK